jgi:hypothetical protein
METASIFEIFMDLWWDLASFSFVFFALSKKKRIFVPLI